MEIQEEIPLEITEKKIEPPYCKNCENQIIDLSNHSHMLQELLKRWWYVTPEWPPLDANYGPQFLKNKLRLVPYNEWY